MSHLADEVTAGAYSTFTELLCLQVQAYLTRAAKAQKRLVACIRVNDDRSGIFHNHVVSRREED